MIAHGSRLSVANSRGKEETKTRQDNVHHLSKTTQTHTHTQDTERLGSRQSFLETYVYICRIRAERSAEED